MILVEHKINDYRLRLYQEEYLQKGQFWYVSCLENNEESWTTEDFTNKKHARKIYDNWVRIMQGQARLIEENESLRIQVDDLKELLDYHKAKT